MCTQHLIIVGVMEESVYWVIGETNPLGLPSPIFPWVLPLQAMHCRLFTLLLQRQVWKAEPTLQTPLCLVGCPDTKQFCRNEEVQGVDWKEQLFFKAKAGIKEILAEMSNSAVYWILHTVWTEDETRKFRLNIFLGHTFGHSLSIGFAHRTTTDATRPNGLHRSTSWSLILMQKILDFWSLDKTWMERGRRKILW